MLGGPAFLAACGDDEKSSDSGSSGSSSSGLGTLDVQLNWVKNAEYAGTWIADSEGYFTDAGFDKVNFIAGGPGVSQEESVISGKGLIGLTAPDFTASAVLEGADLVILGALFQKNPFCFMSLASNPIPDPEALKGKKVGIEVGFVEHLLLLNGLKNKRGTIAMARTNDPHSATAQFFINTVDNDFLDFKAPMGQGWGYCVFGEVVEGLDVVDKIRAVATGNKGFHQDVPKEDVIIEKAEIV